MKKNYKNNEGKNEELKEPSIGYQTKNTFKIFNSFEESKQNGIDFIIKQSPIERIQQTIALILRAYGVTNQDLRNRAKNNTIRVVKTA